MVVESKSTETVNQKYFKPIWEPEDEPLFNTVIPVTGAVSYSLLCARTLLVRPLVGLAAGGPLPVPPTSWWSSSLSGIRAYNILLINSHIGIGLFLYSRPHLRVLSTTPHSLPHAAVGDEKDYGRPACRLPANWTAHSLRVLFPVFGSVMFNFGSLLIFTITRKLFIPTSVTSLPPIYSHDHHHPPQMPLITFLRSWTFPVGLSIALSGPLLYLGYSYVTHLDSLIPLANNIQASKDAEKNVMKEEEEEEHADEDKETNDESELEERPLNEVDQTESVDPTSQGDTIDGHAKSRDDSDDGRPQVSGPGHQSCTCVNSLGDLRPETRMSDETHL